MWTAVVVRKDEAALSAEVLGRAGCIGEVLVSSSVLMRVFYSRMGLGDFGKGYGGEEEEEEEEETDEVRGS